MNKSRKWVPKHRAMANRTSPTPSVDKMKPIDEEKLVKVKVNSTMVEELERSLIGESVDPRSVEVLSQTLTNQWNSITKVRDLGPYKFIVTFMEKEDMEHAIETKNPLLMQYFSHVCPWDIYQQGDTRRIWLEVMGIPPQVWSRDTCEKIADKFGVLVCCDSSSENPDSFVTCRMMIDTNIMSYIAEVVYLSIDEQSIGKSIFVREGLNLTTCYIKPPELNLNLSSHQWDDTLSVRNHVEFGVQDCEGVKLSENMATAAETADNNDQAKESERTVTVTGDVNYDINEEMDIISMRRRLDGAHLENPSDTLSYDDDCPLASRRFSMPKSSRGSPSLQQRSLIARALKIQKKSRAGKRKTYS